MSVSLRAAALAMCLAGVLLPGVASAASVRADLDGDGARDRIEVGAKPTELAVRFSTGHSALRLNAGDLILQFVVADLNRDGHPDLIADTRRSGLRIWINKGRGRFVNHSHRFRNAWRPVRSAILALQSPTEQDSALNDPLRLFVVLPSHHGEHLVALRCSQTTTRAAAATWSHRRRIPRGPPRLLIA